MHLEELLRRSPDVEGIEIRKYTDIQQLPNELWQLTGLQELRLGPGHMAWTDMGRQREENWSCSRLDSLPAGISSLTGLTCLGLNGCDGLVELPDSISCLASLARAELQRCRLLTELPASFAQLRALTWLDLHDCSQLTHLPPAFGDQQCLPELCLEGCESLIELPASLGNLARLTSLVLRRCTKLAHLPNTIGDLGALRILDIFRSRCVVLPDSVTLLTKSERLEAAGVQVQSLPAGVVALTGLTRLDLSYAVITSLPDSICGLIELHELDLSCCRRLEQLPSAVGNLASLTFLNVSDCERLTHLPGSFGRLPLLGKLNLNRSGGVCLPDSATALARLQHLEAACPSLERLPDGFGMLTGLTYLYLSNARITSLPGSLSRLPNLEDLQMFSCKQLEQLPNALGSLTKLTALDIGGCSRLARLPGSCSALTALQRLACHGCLAIEDPPPGVFPKRIDQQCRLGYLQLLWLLGKQHKRDTITKLATQQEPMLRTLERMSWLVVLLATATFIAYLQPPGGLEGNHVLVSGAASCFDTASQTSADEMAAKGLTGVMQCAMVLFFAFDGLSFRLSIGCLTLIVVLSMPRMQWASDHAEAGRFYLYLVSTWLLLFLAVLFGFAAFVASGLSVHNHIMFVVGPVIPGSVLLAVGFWAFTWRFYTLFPGWSAIRAAGPFVHKELADPESDVELGQSNFWRQCPEVVARLQPAMPPGAQAQASTSSAEADPEASPLLSGAHTSSCMQPPADPQQRLVDNRVA